jgi:hypothetical protein
MIKLHNILRNRLNSMKGYFLQDWKRFLMVTPINILFFLKRRIAAIRIRTQINSLPTFQLFILYILIFFTLIHFHSILFTSLYILYIVIWIYWILDFLILNIIYSCWWWPNISYLRLLVYYNRIRFKQLRWFIYIIAH